ncbi:MAG: LytTR family DNA-binding domain-containing protein [Saprospiraceae bacterium]|nr:LytTR family DNA-binding domain-containing protein [Saprospiraceae bacterium]
MKVLIIEDEISNSKRLKKLLKSINPEIKVLATIESVEDTEEWFANNQQPDLVFMDVQLSDGICFEIFESTEIECPIVFTTAFDEYAIKAFSVNSIDYLLKPINENDLTKSIAKYEKLKKKNETVSKIDINSLIEQIDFKQIKYKSRFLIKFGQSYKTIVSNEIAYFSVDNQLVHLNTISSNKYVIDSTMDDLEKSLNPNEYFRINRKFIVSLKSIKAIHTYFNGRLKLELLPICDDSDDVIVAREKVKDFKVWLDD